MPTSEKTSPEQLPPKSAEEFFNEQRGQRRDKQLHNAILDQGDHEGAAAIARKVARRCGLTAKQIAKLLPKHGVEALAKAFDESQHPRIPAGEPDGGQFTSDGGAGGTGALEGGKGEKPLDPAVVNVGGDEWNKETAIRLEREYQKVKPDLEHLAVTALEAKPSTEEEPEEEDEEHEYVPESWDEVSNDKQEEIKNAWMEDTYNDYLQDEKNYYYESGNALDEAKYNLASKGPDEGWVHDALNELREERKEAREPNIPFSNIQLIKALSFEDYETGYEGAKDVDISWDDDELDASIPEGLAPEPTLPGIEAEKPSSKLTQDMRDAIEKKIVKEFNDKADNDADDQEMPEYYAENIAENQSQQWDDGMTDKSKFNWAVNHDHIEEPLDKPSKPAETTRLTALPDHYDPLGEFGSDQDYKRTKLLGLYMSVERIADVMFARGLFEKRAAALSAAHNIENRIWDAWKGSSTSMDGNILQAATAMELGGRLRGLGVSHMTKLADERFKSAGGWEGIKAYVRGKWETTQYLLDKANHPVVELYRAINVEHAGREEKLSVMLPVYEATAKPDQYTKLPDINLQRNGAQSTSTDPEVPNKWTGVGAVVSAEHRVVLRLSAPRTSVLSVPAYGQNMASEHEVVVAGTAWHEWDAWRKTAPSFSAVPMKVAA